MKATGKLKGSKIISADSCLSRSTPSNPKIFLKVFPVVKLKRGKNSRFIEAKFPVYI